LIPINAPPAEDCTLEAMRTQACANQCMDFKGLLFAQPSIKWRHSSGLSFAAFASLRLSENRRLNEKAHFSPRRKGAKWRHLFLLVLTDFVVCGRWPALERILATNEHE